MSETYNMRYSRGPWPNRDRRSVDRGAVGSRAGAGMTGSAVVGARANDRWVVTEAATATILSLTANCRILGT